MEGPWRAARGSEPAALPRHDPVRELVDPVELLVQDRLDLGLHLRQLRALPEDALRGRRLGLVDWPADLRDDADPDLPHARLQLLRDPVRGLVCEDVVQLPDV